MPTIAIPWAALLICASCAMESYDRLEPGERPAPGTPEAGFWRMTERVEEDLRTSGNRVDDPRLNAYLREVLCQVAPAHCGDVRIYVMRVPEFNASMAPNGAMVIWTGLLLRVENEAQLATVMGHEMIHYLERHTLRRWQDAVNKSGAAVVAGFVVPGAGIAAVFSVLGYSRDQEREADGLGLGLTINAGYDPREAAVLWRALEEEKETSGDDADFVFFSTHPGTEERAESLEQAAAEAWTGERQWRAGREPYLEIISPIRGELLRDELRKRDFDTTLLILDRVAAADPGDGEIAFYRGELYRLRGERGDNARALDAYRAAQQFGAVPPELHRSEGLVRMELGQREAARSAFEQYLEAAPNGPDSAMINAYLDRM